MHTARRVYVYLICGVALGMLLVGVRTLLTVLFTELGLGGDLLLGGPSVSTGELSLALALIGVGGPVWGVHWWFAERSLAPERPGAEEERTSLVRALYLTILLGVLLGLGAQAATGLIGTWLARAFGESNFFAEPVSVTLATLLTVIAAWAYHVSIRRRDMRAGPLVGIPAWLPRVYLYLAAFGGGAILLFGIAGALEAAAYASLGQDPFVGPGFAAPIAAAVVGGVIWAVHAWYASRLLRDPGWRGASERPARLRLAYFVAALAGGAGGAIFYLSQALQPVLAAALTSDLSRSDLTSTLATRTTAGALFALAVALHARSLRAEAGRSEDPDRAPLAWHLERYALGLAGLLFAGIGVAGLIGVAMDRSLGSGDVLGGSLVAALQVGQYAPYAVLGGGLWLWQWWQVQSRWAADPTLEAAATERRAALLLVLAAVVIVGLSALAVILYRLFGLILGAGLSGDAVAELSTPVGILLTATVLGVYHGWLLRRDIERRTPEAVTPEAVTPEAVTPEAVTPEAVTPEAALQVTAAPAPIPKAVATWEDEGGPIGLGRGLPLVLRGPEGEDMDAALAAAREALPEGYRLERD